MLTKVIAELLTLLKRAYYKKLLSARQGLYLCQEILGATYPGKVEKLQVTTISSLLTHGQKQIILHLILIKSLNNFVLLNCMFFFSLVRYKKVKLSIQFHS